MLQLILVSGSPSHFRPEKLQGPVTVPQLDRANDCEFKGWASGRRIHGACSGRVGAKRPRDLPPRTSGRYSKRYFEDRNDRSIFVFRFMSSMARRELTGAMPKKRSWQCKIRLHVLENEQSPGSWHAFLFLPVARVFDMQDDDVRLLGMALERNSCLTSIDLRMNDVSADLEDLETIEVRMFGRPGSCTRNKKPTMVQHENVGI